MATLSFQKQFAPRVESGEKTHSIRPKRRRPEQWLPGKTLHLFTAMRTKHCRKLGIGTITSVHDIEIHAGGVVLDGALINEASWLTSFARADGFVSWPQLVAFLKDFYSLPFSGDLIKWQLNKPAASSESDFSNAQEGTSMTKAELVANIAEMAHQSKATVEAVLESFEVAVKSGLSKGEEVPVPGLGKFSVSSRKARTGRNPKTGEEVAIAAKKVAIFSAAKGLRDSVNI